VETKLSKFGDEIYTQQAVLVHLRLIDHPLGSDRERAAVFDLEDMLRDAIDDQGVGLFDGEEFGEGRCVLYMYCPDADRLFAVIEPILKAAPFARGGFAIKQYGPAADLSTPEVRVNLY
jgi:hypothetical protein